MFLLVPWHIISNCKIHVKLESGIRYLIHTEDTVGLPVKLTSWRKTFTDEIGAVPQIQDE